MKTTIKYFYDEDMYDKEPLITRATLDCKERNDIDRARAIKMINSIKGAMNDEN